MSEVIRLLESYVDLGGGTLEQLQDGLFRFDPGPEHRPWFGRSSIHLAVAPDDMDLHPEAELAVIGSRFAEQLIGAIRQRGARLDRGFVEGPGAASGAPAPTLRLRRGTVDLSDRRTAWLPVGRLHVTASVRAGHDVSDHVVSTGFFDLMTGQPVSVTLEAGEELPSPGQHPVSEMMGLERLLPAMLKDIEARLSDQVTTASTDAATRLDHELARLDRYFGGMIEEERARRGADADQAVEAFQRDHERRRAEELSRHQVSAQLRPVQLEVLHILAEYVEATMTDGAATGRVVGRRLSMGPTEWSIGCPTCHRSSPSEWAVCAGGHVTCGGCTAGCAECGKTECHHHGGGTCPDDGGHGVCSEHARTCRSCGDVHCATHGGNCATHDHPTCAKCLTTCDACGISICPTHAFDTTPASWRPDRGNALHLCTACVRYCRGQAGEIRAPTEVEVCQTCGVEVCGDHFARCDVDGAIHCASHVARTDRTRRIVCPEHRAQCSFEPHLMLAVDEVGECVTCGASACTSHLHRCYHDDAPHCETHSIGLAVGEYSCPAHAAPCAVEGHATRLSDLEGCPVCGNRACSAHRRECESCRRTVCGKDIDGSPATCRTCATLRPRPDPDDVLLEGLRTLFPDLELNAGAWKVGRDAAHHVARVDLGWGRSLVLAVDHHTELVSHAVQHGWIRSKKLR